METVRDQVIEAIKQLPLTVTTEDIMEELFIRLKVEKSIAELEAGKGIPHEEIKERFQECFE